MNEETDLVIERVLDAPRNLVWKAWTTPEHLKKFWCPKPYETPQCDMDLRPGGKFYTKMVGPGGFLHEGTGCFLEIVDGAKVVWTTALGEGFRPNVIGAGEFPFTAIMSFADAGDGKTLYRAVAMHADPAAADRHAKMGFHDGWGTVAGQLEEVAKGLA